MICFEMEVRGRNSSYSLFGFRGECWRFIVIGGGGDDFVFVFVDCSSRGGR